MIIYDDDGWMICQFLHDRIHDTFTLQMCSNMCSPSYPIIEVPTVVLWSAWMSDEKPCRHLVLVLDPLHNLDIFMCHDLPFAFQSHILCSNSVPNPVPPGIRSSAATPTRCYASPHFTEDWSIHQIHWRGRALCFTSDSWTRNSRSGLWRKTKQDELPPWGGKTLFTLLNLLLYRFKKNSVNWFCTSSGA